jgi:predicted small lipoprotein YifL
MFRIVGLSIAIAIMVSSLLLCGCGQKGPLYLPSDNQEEQK